MAECERCRRLARAWDWVKSCERDGNVTKLHYAYAIRKLHKELDDLLAKYPVDALLAKEEQGE